MIIWEHHLRLLALLIPTWLLLGAVVITLAVSSKSAAEPASTASAAQLSPAGCKDTGDVAPQQRNGDLVVWTEWYRPGY